MGGPVEEVMAQLEIQDVLTIHEKKRTVGAKAEADTFDIYIKYNANITLTAEK